MQMDADGLSAREIFNLLRAEHGNTAALATELLGEDGLQQRLRIISGMLRPLHREFIDDHDARKQGQFSMMLFAARRANFAFYKCVAETLTLMLDPAWIDELGLCPRSNSDSVLPQENLSMRAEESLLRTLFSFSVHLASNRAWSQSFFCLGLPYILGGIYHPEAQGRASVMARMQAMAEAVLDLENYTQQFPADAFAAGLLQDLSTNKWQVTRELLVQGTQCGWDGKDSELQALAWALFAGPSSTNDVIEQAFGWLKDSLRSSKNKVMCGWTKFLYLLTAPYGPIAGIPCLTPTRDDFLAFLHCPDPATEIAKLKPFKPNSKKIGKKILPSMRTVSQIRPAGFHTNRNSAAAMSYLLMERRSGRSMDQMLPAWPGSLGYMKASV